MRRGNDANTCTRIKLQTAADLLDDHDRIYESGHLCSELAMPDSVVIPRAQKLIPLLFATPVRISPCRDACHWYGSAGFVFTQGRLQKWLHSHAPTSSVSSVLVWRGRRRVPQALIHTVQWHGEPFMAWNLLPSSHRSSPRFSVNDGSALWRSVLYTQQTFATAWIPLRRAVHAAVVI